MSIQRNSLFIRGEGVVLPPTNKPRPADRDAGACPGSHPGTAFPGGADIKQFGTPKTMAKPKLKLVHGPSRPASMHQPRLRAGAAA